MNSALFYNILQKKFPFKPTVKQDIFFQQISEFITNSKKEEIFVLKGYAGTGKTTVISTIVTNLIEINKKYVFGALNHHFCQIVLAVVVFLVYLFSLVFCHTAHHFCHNFHFTPSWNCP